MRLSSFKALVVGRNTPVRSAVVMDLDRFVGGYWNDRGDGFIAMFAEAVAAFDLSKDEAVRLLREVTGWNTTSEWEQNKMACLMPPETKTTASGIKLS